MIPLCIINITFLTFVFLLTKLLDITNLIVNYNIGVHIVLLTLVYSMPTFLEFVIPMSIMTAILLTFLRLSSDNEIIALKAAGISPYNLLPSVMLFCFIGFIFTGFMTIYGLPWGRLSLKNVIAKVAVSNPNVGLKERTFNNNFEGITLYINQIDAKNRALIDVFIEDQRAKNIVSIITAPKGELFNQSDKPTCFHLRLYNGAINQVDHLNNAVHSINFATYDVNLNLQQAFSASTKKAKDEKEMSLVKLYQYLKTANKKDVKYYKSKVEFHRKFSLPCACFTLGLLAVSLGLQSVSAKRSFGLGLCFICFLAYYLMLSAGLIFGKTGAYPPIIGMWLPNIVMGGIGVCLFIKAANERSLHL